MHALAACKDFDRLCALDQSLPLHLPGFYGISGDLPCLLHNFPALHITAQFRIHNPNRRRYFDRSGAGYLKVDDLRRLLHNLGAGLPHRLVKELATVAADASGSRGRGERAYYRDITDKAPPADGAADGVVTSPQK